MLDDDFFDIDSSDDDSHHSSSSDDDDEKNNYHYDDTGTITPRHLKPALQKGDKVWAAWWDDYALMNTKGAPWYEGTVHAVREVDRFEDSRASKYGPVRLYDIHYDDGDELTGVLDVFVFPEKDYHLNKIKDVQWKGVRPKVSKFSRDRYAREVGFYAITTSDGKEQIFSTLYEAMIKADEQIILRKSGNVCESDLNLPEHYVLTKKRERAQGQGADNEDDPPKKKKKNKEQDLVDTDSDFEELMEEESGDESTDAPFQDMKERGSSGDSHNGGEQSKYTGVIFIKSTNRYRGLIRINRHGHQLGNYVLGADAANAHDLYCRTKHISDRGFNFQTEKEFKDARSNEIARRRLTLEEATTLAEVTERLRVFEEKWSGKRPGKKQTIVDYLSSQSSSSSSSSSSSDDHSLSSVDSDVSPLAASTTLIRSDYTGVEYNDRKEKHWTALIYYNGEDRPVGVYDLESDAAHVHDVVATILNVSNGEPNFDSESAYTQARKQEAEKLGLNLESIDSVKKSLGKAQIYVNNLLVEAGTMVESVSRKKRSPPSAAILTERMQRRLEPADENMKKIADLNGSLTKKWKIPAANRSLFLDSYQQSLAEMLGCTSKDETNKHDTPIGTVVSISPAHVQSHPNVQLDLEAAKMKDIDQGLVQRELSLYEDENRLSGGEKSEVKYTGVTKVKDKNRFRGTQWYNRTQKTMGDYLLKADAAHARDEFCRSFNLNRVLNFNTEEEYENARAKEIAQRGLTLDAADTLAKKKDVNSLSDVAARLLAKKAKWDVESRESKSHTQVLPETKSQSKETTQDDDSDDNISLFSDVNDEQENFAPSQDSVAVTLAVSNVVKPKKLSEMKLVSATKEQEESLEFPLGCHVLWKLHDESFQRGVVSSAWLNMIPPIRFVYKVEPLNGESKQIKSACELAFDTRCPVYINSSPTDNNNHLVEGEVLLSRTDDTKTLYTILIKKKGNEFQLEHDVPSDLVRFRKAEKENNSPSQRVPNVSEPNLHSEEREAQTKMKGPEREIIGHCGMSISTSNSTISTKDSGHMSTLRGHRDGRSIDIELPHWLVSDNAVREHLYLHLIGNPRGGKPILDQVYDKTNCTLRMPSNNSVSVIRIETMPGKFALEQLRSAKVELENILMEYLNDNSIGRLFHHFALSCRHLHPQRGNSCVYQRNPWQLNEMGYMSVVELPKIGNDFHASHIFSTLSRVRKTGCTMKVIDRFGRFPTRFASHVWVWGQRPEDVDEAVGILNDANKHHAQNWSWKHTFGFGASAQKMLTRPN